MSEEEAAAQQKDFKKLPPRCVHLTDVCADQSNYVLYSPEYRPNAQRPHKLPIFSPDSKYNYPWIAGSNPDALVRGWSGKERDRRGGVGGRKEEAWGSGQWWY